MLQKLWLVNILFCNAHSAEVKKLGWFEPLVVILAVNIDLTVEDRIDPDQQATPLSTLFANQKWTTSSEKLFMPYATNKGADQPAHPHSLISGFVAGCLDSIIPIFAISKTFKMLASLGSWRGWFESYLVAHPNDRFSCDVAQMMVQQDTKFNAIVAVDGG